MLERHTIVCVIAVAASLAACSSTGEVADRDESAESAESIGHAQSSDSISAADDPLRLIGNASSRLADNLVPGDVGQTFGLPDERVPYPDTYWPFIANGIDDRWVSQTEPSPLEKYMAITAPSRTAAAQTWEHTNHGTDVPGVQGWFGHCPGWVAASILTKPVTHEVWARRTGTGVAACSPEDAGCTHFAIGDINALAAEVYNDGGARFIGARCDTAPADIERDQYGRIVRNGTGCKGLNAGSLLIVLGARLKRDQLAVAIDAQFPYNTDQIWNQPAYRFAVHRFEPIDAAEAANLVASGARTGSLTSYPWNAAARGFALVDLEIWWVSEYGPNTAPVSGLRSTRTTRVVGVIELDRDATDASARIIGGEYVDDVTVAANKLTVPPFVWIPLSAGHERLPTWVNGRYHNPYVRPSIVQKLMSMGQ